ncbi:MAG TPA: 8-oxo-dGTP diphosphatase [Nautiliaceae bacterium]|nr:8-oxo-dGTP diphosphatase [Nautiliaceae bacterium]
MFVKVFLETLVYPLKEDKVLLIKKKRGLGKGFWNGPGGKIEENEDIEKAAIRELEEETRLKAKKLEFRAFLEFFEIEEKELHYVYVFVTEDFEGKEEETEEALPKWFKIDELPLNQMWEDDKYWIKKVLKGEKIYAKFKFKQWKLVDKEIYSLVSLNTN